MTDDMKWKLAPVEADDGMIEAGHEKLLEGSEWGRMVYAAEIYDAMLAASPPAPCAEPVGWQWRSRVKGGAWDAWENGRYGQPAPPFMDVEERPIYASPIDPAAIRAEARREALEEMRAAIHAHLPAIPVALADAIRALIDKEPGR